MRRPMENIVMSFLPLLMILAAGSATTGAHAEEAGRKAQLLWLTVPDHRWAFLVLTPGFTLETDELKRNSRGGWSRAVLARDDTAGLIVSAHVEQEPGHKKRNAATLRDEQWPQDRRSGQVSEFSKVDRDGLIGVEYVTRGEGAPADSKEMHCYWVKEDCWIELHVSKPGFKPSEQARFEELSRSARILPGSDPNVRSKFTKAGQLYKTRKFEEAILLYEDVLASEEKETTLDHDQWRVLIEHLGMAYGMRGDLAKSRATLEYGKSKDPGYPMFYYALACGYAEANDLDKVIRNLRLAYRHRKNGIEGEILPDPRTDEPFKRYRVNDRFMKAVAVMEKGSR